MFIANSITYLELVFCQYTHTNRIFFDNFCFAVFCCCDYAYANNLLFYKAVNLQLAENGADIKKTNVYLSMKLTNLKCQIFAGTAAKLIQFI